MSKTARIILGYGLFVLLLLVGYTGYKLVSTGWFGNVTYPTLLVLSFLFCCFAGLYCHWVANYFASLKKPSKETK